MPPLLARLRERLVEVAARRPGGWLGRLMYGSLSSLDSFGTLALDRLELAGDDRYLEIGQGGGALVARALETVASAAAVDHSPDMVALARKRNAEAVAAGRCQIVVGDAGALPWRDGTFTCCACVATFLFFQRPVQVLREMHRVLSPGGRLVIITPGEEAPAFVRGLQSDDEGVRLYSPAAFEDLLRDAGFSDWTVGIEKKRLLAVARTETVGAEAI